MSAGMVTVTVTGIGMRMFTMVIGIGMRMFTMVTRIGGAECA